MPFDSHRFISTSDDDKRLYGLQDKRTGVTVWCPFPEGVEKITTDDVVEDMNHQTGPVADIHRTLVESFEALDRERL